MSDTPTLQFDPDREGLHVDLPKLVASRMLIQANSGGGKSWATRYMLEQTHGRIQQLVIDPEGEFGSLREAFPYLLAGRDGDVPATPRTAKVLCRHLVELGASAVIDIYDLDLQDRRRFVRLFLEELMRLPRRLWRPLLVVVDEAHRFVPERGKSEAADAVTTLCTQGRKRGYAAVLVTQRLSKLSKDAAAELLNKLIGRTHLDVDVRRAGDDLGFDKQGRQRLKRLQPGEFYVYGPAIGREVTLVRTGDVRTTHPEPGKIAPAPPPPPEEIRRLVEQMQDLDAEAEEEERTIDALEGQVRDLRTRLRKAERAAENGKPPAPDVAEVRKAVHDELLEEFTAQLHDHLAEAIAAGAAASAARIRPFLEELGEKVGAIQQAAEGVSDLVEDRLPEVLGDLEEDPPMPEDLRVAGFAPLERTRGGTAKRPARKPTPREREPEVGVAPEAVIAEAVDRDRLGGGERKVLDALAILESVGIDEAADENVAAFAGYTHSGGTYQNYRGALRSKGLIEYRGNLRRLTGAGRALANYPPRPPTLEALHEAWFDLLPRPHGALLRELIDIYPEDMTSEELAERTGYTASGGTFQNYRGRLSSLGLAEYPAPGRVRAAELLFPEGLT